MAALGNERNRTLKCLDLSLRENEDAQLFLEAKFRNKFRLQSARRLILIFYRTKLRSASRKTQLSLLSGFLCSAFLKDRLRSSQSRDWHQERRGAHVIEPDLMAELHAR
jgi:hypothetical protein